MESPPRVLIADDHPPMRFGIRLALEDAGLVVCAEASTAEEAVAQALRTRPDVCLLDISMPGGGIAAAQAITRELSETIVVMLTVSDDDGDLFDSLRAGASGYLLKDTPPTRLPYVIYDVLAGKAVIPRRFVGSLITEFRRRDQMRRQVPQNHLARLSSREWEVLELLGEGATTSQMADRLFISPGTVRSHISMIVKKLHVDDRASAVRLVQGIAEAPATEDAVE